ELAQQMRLLRGATVTILGFGHIGEWIARLLAPFGVRIVGVRRTKTVQPAFLRDTDRIVTLDELDQVLTETHHLVATLPGGRATDLLMDARRLALLPREAIVYNIGRGNVFDEGALAAALAAGKLAGACLDVFREEPLQKDSPLRECPNTLLLPHCSAIAPKYLDIYIREFAREYATWAAAR
ncbi:MAG: D-2-hydroxyacid dehydrogenase, partial [Lentisphaerae bacterium]|nr:D-2-hydroxyacid dehydrogenase [Lentisphaerota bacterium]